MIPFVLEQLGLGADIDRIAGPKMDQRSAQVTIAQEHLVATTAGISPRSRAGKNNRALLVVRRAHPKRHREWRRTLEVTDAEIHSIVASQLQSIAVFAGNDFILLAARRLFRFASEIRQLSVLEFVERKVANLPG